MLPGPFQHQGSPPHGFRSQSQSGFPGQSHGYPCVCKRIQSRKHVGGAATGNGGNGIHPGFRHLVNGAAAGKQHPGRLFIFIFYAVSRTVGDDAGQHHARGVGHGAYNARSVAGAGFHIIQGNGGSDRNQKGKLLPPFGKRGNKRKDAMRLHGQNQDFHGVRRIRLRGRFMNSGVFLPQSLHVLMVMIVHPNFLRNRCSGFQHAPQQGASHFSKSDDTCFHG